MKLKATDVANVFIDYYNHTVDDTITNLKLNKLLYFAQGYSLAIYDKPLFDEEFEAWEHGPVVPEVYLVYKDYGKQNISTFTGPYNYDEIDIDIIELLITIIEDYGDYPSSTFIDMSHEKNSPWGKVYEPKKNKIISKESISDYFKNLKVKIPKIDFDKIETIGRIDPKTKLTILPSYLDDKKDYSEYLKN